MIKNIMMALKNIFRNKRRTIITLVVISFGTFILIMTNGILQNMASKWQDGLVNGMLGHVQIIAEKLKEEGSIKYFIPDKNKIISELKKYPEVEGFNEMINISGLISTGKETKFFYGEGVDPEKTRKYLPEILNVTKAGEYLKGTDYDGAVLGRILAEKLKVKIGDVLMLVTNDKYGALNSVDIRVVGLFYMQNEFENEQFIQIHINSARKLLSYDDNEISKLVIKLKVKDPNEAFTIKEKMKEGFKNIGGVELYGWNELATQFNQVQGVFSGISSVMIFILLILVLFGIMNTILMNVFERMSEIGTLMAIGASRGQIISTILFESFWIGLIGTVIGAVVSFIVITLINIGGGLVLPPPPGGSEATILAPVFLLDKTINSIILIIIISVIAGIYPARYAAKLKPIKALGSK